MLALTEVGIDASGISWLTEHPGAVQSAGAISTVTGSLVLTSPVSVLAVPPSSISVGGGNATCVTTPEGVRRVRVLGSRLGTSFVEPSDPEPRIVAVAVDPARVRPCG